MPKAYFSVQKQQAKLKLAAMDGNSPSAELDSNVPELKPEIQTSKRRKVIEKTVVRVKIGENAGKLKNEGPPSDSWSWRKYGQKPIKGSPHPRGYYRCSTSKGCSAKKQVERCRTDASVLIITYTSSHNHPGPDIHEISLQNQQPTEPQTPPSEDHPTTPKQEDPQEEEKQNQPIIAKSDEDASEEGHYNFHYLQYPLGISQDIMISQEELDPFSTDQNSEKSGNDTLGNLILDEDPITCSRLQMVTCSAPKSSSSDDQNNDFFDELEELPTTSSAFTSFMRGNYFDERIPVVPS